jgi:FkbM family methyltransferase
MLALPGCALVVAVEADPGMVAGLQARFAVALAATAPRLVLVAKALQDDPDRLTIPWRSSPTHPGRSSIVSQNATRPTIWEGTEGMVRSAIAAVPATTIDQAIPADTPPVAFLKLDLEGADLIALRGGAATLTRDRPVVAFENSIHAPAVHGFTVAEMAAWFAAIDYVPLDFLGAPMTPERWFGFFEAWAVPRERLGALQALIAQAVAARAGGPP